MKNYDSYMPVDPDFYEVTEIFLKKNVKVFYFGKNDELEEAKGILTGVKKIQFAEFIDVENNELVRLDKIITINGKPGPAFDKYDAYANACLSCQSGYDE